MSKEDFDGDELLALARVDVEANRLEAALAKVKQGFKLQDFPNELNALGAKLYAQLRLFDKAKTLYKQYLEVSPKALTEHFQLGMVHLDSGDRDQALKTWQEVLSEHPTHPPALFYSSVVLLENGDKDSAKRNIDVLLKSAPVSNLYFEKAKELLARLNQSNSQTNESIAPDFAYNKES